jgi:hypothetical protein
MTQDLELRRQAILKKMGELRTMRRGTVSEQFLDVPHKGQAKPVRRGPYYLWQYWERGIPKRQRLHAGAEVESVRKEVAAYKEFDLLCKEYVSIAEALAQEERDRSVSEQSLKKGLKSRSSGTRKLRG